MRFVVLRRQLLWVVEKTTATIPASRCGITTGSTRKKHPLLKVGYQLDDEPNLYIKEILLFRVPGDN